MILRIGKKTFPCTDLADASRLYREERDREEAAGRGWRERLSRRARGDAVSRQLQRPRLGDREVRRYAAARSHAGPSVVDVFTREQLRDWGFEVVDGAAVRIKDARVDVPPQAVSMPTAPSSRRAPSKEPRRAPTKARRSSAEAFDRALQVDGWRSGDILYLTLAIPPRTKKNNKEWHGRESAGYRRFRQRVMNAIQLVTQRLRLPLPERPYNARVLFIVDNQLADAVGLYQGLADSLQDSGVIHSDWWLRSWNGSEVVYDREAPGMVILLEPCECLPGAPVRKVEDVASAAPSAPSSRSHGRPHGRRYGRRRKAP